MSAFVINPYAFAGEDADAKAYLDAVESADGQALEAGVRKAVDDFVIGCKADGIWSAIKACCILAGARTLDGALTPLVGSAPTNVGGNFVSGDYDREDGLIGNGGSGNSKYLNTNRANNADPQNDNHNAVYIHTVDTAAGGSYLSAGGANAGANNLISFNTNRFHRTRNRSSSAGQAGPDPAVAGFLGISRSASGSFSQRSNGSTTTASIASQSPTTDNLFVFARNNGSGTPLNYSNARIQFYSIGESLDLADLDTRVSTLMTDLAAAI